MLLQQFELQAQAALLACAWCALARKACCCCCCRCCHHCCRCCHHCCRYWNCRRCCRCSYQTKWTLCERATLAVRAHRPPRRRQRSIHLLAGGACGQRRRWWSHSLRRLLPAICSPNAPAAPAVHRLAARRPSCAAAPRAGRLLHPAAAPRCPPSCARHARSVNTRHVVQTRESRAQPHDHHSRVRAHSRPLSATPRRSRSPQPQAIGRAAS